MVKNGWKNFVTWQKGNNFKIHFAFGCQRYKIGAFDPVEDTQREK